MIRITKRDEALFRAISKYNFLTTKQIQEKIFPKLKHATMLRRLRKLEKVKLIRRIGFLESGMRVWGNTALAMENFGNMRSASRANLHTLPHDVLLTDVRTIVEGLATIHEWYDSRHVQLGIMEDPLHRDFREESGFYHPNGEPLLPDGLFLAKKNGKFRAFSLELELQHKSQSRVNRIVNRYNRKDCIENPWFVVRTWKIAQSYFRATEGYGNSGKKIYVTMLNDLFEKKAEAQVYCSNGTKILLREVFDCEGFVRSTARTESSPSEQTTEH